MAKEIDLEDLRISTVKLQTVQKKRKLPMHNPGELFLRGPIPMRWLDRAGQQSGKALHVAVDLWMWAMINKSPVVKFSATDLTRFGIKRNSASRGLEALEKAGLVSVERHAGRKPIVTILDYKNS